ncbi:MAG: hypothetical protein ACLTCI_06555 [[Clostridium] nexile]
MLKEIEDEILEEMGRAIQEHPIEEEKVFIFLYRICSGCWQQTGKLACALKGPHGDIAFVRRIENFLEQYSRHVRGDMLPEQLAEISIFTHFAGMDVWDL